LVLQIFSDLGYNEFMGILDNLENAWDEEFSFESKPIVETDAMGREKFWEDLGRPDNDGLALKIFKEQCCDNCNC
jgi:hypothetical protein